jgi:dCTP deaminase
MEDSVTTPGVLTDDDIAYEVSNGRLITRNFSQENVKQACYELRAGEVYYDLSGGGDQIAVSDEASSFILLKPHQQIVVITYESLAVPADVVGRVLLKGKLFSLGILPVHTYADPGFKGRLGIVLFNSSANFIRIRVREPLAKIEFERLPKPVSHPYSGQHGFETEIWPLPRQMILDRSKATADRRVGTFDEEVRRAFGPEISTAFARVFRYERRLLISVIAYVGVSVVIVIYVESTGRPLSLLFAFVVGLLTNIVSGLLTVFATRTRVR